MSLALHNMLVGGNQEGEPPHTPYKEDSDSEEEEEEIAAVEMILETYFMHCDNTYNKLQTLCEIRHTAVMIRESFYAQQAKGLSVKVCNACSIWTLLNTNQIGTWTLLRYDRWVAVMDTKSSLLFSEEIKVRQAQ